jgi:hypothetical protein
MSSSQNTDSRDITQESVSEYLTSRYPDRSFDDFSRLLPELVGALRSGSFYTIGDLRKTLERTKKVAEDFEARHPPSQLVGSRHSAIGIVIISVALSRRTDFFTFRTVLDDCPSERLEEYKKHILPESDEPASN